jgi:hypothetical protein
VCPQAEAERRPPTELEVAFLLRLVTFDHHWHPTPLGRNVHQQLAVLHYQGARLEPQCRSNTWREVLVCGWRPLDRGRGLLEWLRLGTLDARCYACDHAATGLAGDYVRTVGWEPGCDLHRTPPWRWGRRAIDLGLDPIPTLPGVSPADAEVGHA